MLSGGANMYKQRFFSTANLIKNFGTALSHYWEPYALGKPTAHPAYAYMLKGNVGHLSLEFKKYNETSIYFSTWPQDDLSDLNPQGEPMKKVRISENFQEDIEEYKGCAPNSKSIEIIEAEYLGLQLFIDNYKKTTKLAGSIDGGRVWSVKSNCADDIYDALRSVNLIQDLGFKVLPRTPKEVFALGLNRLVVPSHSNSPK